MVGCLEMLLADGSLRHNGLDKARPVAKRQEVDLSARAPVVQPALDRDLFAFVLPDVFDVDMHRVGYLTAISLSIRARAWRARASASLGEPRVDSSNVNAPS